MFVVFSFRRKVILLSNVQSVQPSWIRCLVWSPCLQSSCSSIWSTGQLWIEAYHTTTSSFLLNKDYDVILGNGLKSEDSGTYVVCGTVDWMAESQQKHLLMHTGMKWKLTTLHWPVDLECELKWTFIDNPETNKLIKHQACDFCVDHRNLRNVPNLTVCQWIQQERSFSHMIQKHVTFHNMHGWIFIQGVWKGLYSSKCSCLTGPTSSSYKNGILSYIVVMNNFVHTKKWDITELFLQKVTMAIKL